MIKAREKWIAQQLADDGNPKPGPSLPPLTIVFLTILDHQQLTYDIIQQSELGKLMREVFHGLRDDGYIHTKLNGWHVSYALHSSLIPCRVSLSLSLRDFDEYPAVPLRPYQTLLLLDNFDTFLDTLPPGSSTTLRIVARSLKPTKSFSVLQRETGISLAQLYRCA